MVKRQINDVEQYYYNNIELKTGEKILNINRSIRSETDFTRFVASLIKQKTKAFLWLRYTKTTHPIFERLLPILSDWNQFDKKQFLRNGTILVSYEHVICAYPVGLHPQKRVRNHQPLLIVQEEENIIPA